MKELEISRFMIQGSRGIIVKSFHTVISIAVISTMMPSIIFIACILHWSSQFVVSGFLTHRNYPSQTACYQQGTVTDPSTSSSLELSLRTFLTQCTVAKM